MSDINFEEFLTRLRDIIDETLAASGESETKPVAKKGRGKGKAATPAPEPEVEEEEVDEDESEDESDGLADRINELKKKRITELRKIAVGLGFEKDEVAEADKDELATAIAEAEAEDEGEGDDAEESEEAEDEEDVEADEEDEDEDGGDDEAEDEEYTRDDYLAMSLADLKGLAKDAGHKVADLKGLDKDGIADLLLGEESEDEAEEEDDEDGELTEEDLREMSLAELKALCKDYGIKVPRGAKADDLVDLLMEEDEDE